MKSNDINKEIALDLLSFNCFSFILFRQNNKVNLTKLLNKKLTDEQETKDNCKIALDFCSEMYFDMNGNSQPEMIINGTTIKGSIQPGRMASISKVIIIGLAAFHLIKELFQLFQVR